MAEPRPKDTWRAACINQLELLPREKLNEVFCFLERLALEVLEERNRSSCHPSVYTREDFNCDAPYHCCSVCNDQALSLS